jgi:methionyl-tRNA formyltransferase
VPSLERLRAGPHEVAVVVTQPDRPRGRGRRLSPSPVAACALAAGLPLLRPEKVGDDASVEALRARAPDLGVVVAFGQFLPRPVRELPRLGFLVNAHASLLPRHRGAAPIARAILAGDAETGISVMRVERAMDAGPVASMRRLAIGPEETAGELEERLAALAADALAEALDEIAAGRAVWVEQDAAAASFAPKLSRDDARLDFAEPAEALARRIRALAPKPGAVAALRGELLRLLGARAEAGRAGDPPGTVRAAGAGIRIATGAGWLVPTRLQRAGGRPQSAAEFLRGHPIRDGERFERAAGDAP